MKKKGYSRKGFWGQTVHYDAEGNKVGESVKNFLGGYDHYNASGEKTSSSYKNFWGGYTRIDEYGDKTGFSQRGFYGQTNHYDTNGNKVGESVDNAWGGKTHYNTKEDPTRHFSRKTKSTYASESTPNSDITRLTELYIDYFELCKKIAERGFANSSLPAFFHEDVRNFVLHIFGEEQCLPAKAVQYLQDISAYTSIIVKHVFHALDRNKSYVPKSIKLIAYAEQKAIAQEGLALKGIAKTYIDFFALMGKTLLEEAGCKTLVKQCAMNWYILKMRMSVIGNG